MDAPSTPHTLNTDLLKLDPTPEPLIPRPLLPNPSRGTLTLIFYCRAGAGSYLYEFSTLVNTTFTLFRFAVPHPKSFTLHPPPQTPHPTPYIVHPTPHTPHPTPYALHPTLHEFSWPKPYSRFAGVEPHKRFRVKGSGLRGKCIGYRVSTTFTRCSGLEGDRVEGFHQQFSGPGLRVEDLH